MEKSRKVLDRVFTGKIRLLTSPAILLEFEEVLSREKFGLTRIQVQRMGSLLIRSSEVIEPRTKITIITEDPDDNKIIECAVDGRAKYIITGNKHLLKIRRYKNIQIINPNSFLRKMVK